jgi:hypothetical protein
MIYEKKMATEMDLPRFVRHRYSLILTKRREMMARERFREEFKQEAVRQVVE